MIFSFLFTKSYANDDLVFDDNLKTIKELKESIEKLDNDRKELFNEKLDLNSNDLLMSYFRTDLSKQELLLLENIIDDYNKNKKFLESELNLKAKNLEDTTEIKSNLMDVKKNLYKQMTPFIKISHYNDYLSYIKTDTHYYSEKTEIYSDILKKQELVNTKLVLIEDRIREYRVNLEDTLNQIIYQKIEEKISSIENNPNFEKLDNDLKIEILNKTLDRLNSDLEKSLLLSDKASKQKVNIYQIVIKKIIELREEYIKKWEL